MRDKNIDTLGFWDFWEGPPVERSLAFSHPPEDKERVKTFFSKISALALSNFNPEVINTKRFKVALSCSVLFTILTILSNAS